jgi:hypothetical protein
VTQRQCNCAALEERILDLEAGAKLYEAHVENLIERVYELEQRKKGGRKSKQILVSAEGVCGVDPERDSSTCPDAGVYRRQQGCLGAACKAKASEYYANYRKNNP